MKKWQWALLAVVFIALFAGLSLVLRFYLIGNQPSANDFYSRWAGAKALLVDGRDPYSLEVTQEIQPFIGVSSEQVGRGGFHYPLHVLFLIWPLPYLPYPWAQANWQALLIWLLIGTMLVLVRRENWQPASLGLAGLVLAGLFFYPAARTIFLGQFTLHVTLFVALALWAWRNGRYGWAGLALPFTSIKPQMIVLVGLWLVLLALRQRRWRFFAGLLGGGLGLLLGSLLIYPRWVFSFIEDVQRYAGVAGGKNPLVLLGDYVWGGVDWVRYILSGLLILAMLYAWWQSMRDTSTTQRDLDLALGWTVVVSLLVPFQTGTTNQTLLLVVLMPWLYQSVLHSRNATIVAVVGVEAGLWALFLNTLSGNYENPLLFIPLPLFTLFVLIILSWRMWYGRITKQVSFG